MADIPAELVDSNAKESVGGFMRFAGAPTKSFTGIIGTKPVPTEKPLPELNDGDRVRHTTFGDGMVISVTGGIVTVAFKDVKIGIKKLALTIAPLEKI